MAVQQGDSTQNMDICLFQVDFNKEENEFKK